VRTDVVGDQLRTASGDLSWRAAHLHARGVSFLALEFREFDHLVAIGAGPQRSAFLSAFFALVGCHGLHVSIGLIWLVVMMVQVAVKGFAETV
jgi:cytochrome o ubiquinol oxidase subunit III